MKNSIFLKATLCIAFSISSFIPMAYSAETVAATTTQEARYPTEVIARPGIMPTGIAQFSLNAGLKMPNPAMDKTHVTMDVSSEFGIVERLQGSVSYDGFAFSSKQFEATDTVNLGAKYNFFSKHHISPNIAFKVPFHVYGDIVRDFTIGAPFTIYNDVMAGGIFGDLFNLTVRPNVAMKFDFNFWYGVQVYGNLWAELNSSFGSIAMNNDTNEAKWGDFQGFWKKLPLTLAATYAFNHYFDLGANIGFDDTLKAKDTFKFGLTFTARAGRIFG